MDAENRSGEAPRTVIVAELRRLEAFRHLPDDHLARLASLAERAASGPGAVLASEGEADDAFLVIVTGELEVSRATPVGNQVLARLRRGDILGELSFIDGLSRSGTVTATELTELLRFPGHEVKQLVAADAAFAISLLRAFWRSLTAKIRQANRFMTEIMAARESTGGMPSGSAGVGFDLDAGAKLAVLREQGLAAIDLDLLAATLRPERFPPGAFIFAEGDPAEDIYIVAEGQVRISRRLPGIGEEALAILGRGEVFGEMAVADARPRSADARAHTAGCVVLRASWARFESELAGIQLEAAEQFLSLLCRILCKRLRSMNNLLVAWRLMLGFG